MPYAIQTTDLSKEYRAFRAPPVPALQEVSLVVEEGSIVGLIGQNGAGKTTLVKILVGLANSTGGRATVLGAAPSHPLTRQSVGYLPEQMRIHGYFNAEEFLCSMGRLNEVGADKLRRQVPELLDMVGLSGVSKCVRDYSKGMQQRLGLAQALLGDPRLLFLDEPTDGLDPGGRKDVRDLLLALRKNRKTIFLNSHLLSEVEAVCDQIFLLHKGRIVRASTPAEFARGRGEYLLRVPALDSSAVLAIEELLSVPTWKGKTLLFPPCDEVHLNRLIDALRRVPATITALAQDPAGDWQVSVGEVNDTVREAAANALGQGRWEGNALRFRPRDVAHLNAVIDRLRELSVNIEAIEPVKVSLEQFFLETLERKDA
ncbi:MAG TPA: ABC transporter ATP-binding protein [Terriglobales bacterium]|nr:ABC transporter ATP-binding protein [Terriglobales bacterium]